MKHQALFSSKAESKKKKKIIIINVSSTAILLGSLWVNSDPDEKMTDI